MKTAGRENPIQGSHCPATEHMARSVRTDLARSSGCEAKKIPAEGDVFFLDFYLYRTNQELRLRQGGRLGQDGLSGSRLLV